MKRIVSLLIVLALGLIGLNATDIQSVTIGNGSVQTPYPMLFGAWNSLYQTLYTEAELGFTTGTITTVVIYNNFRRSMGLQATRVFLGSTTQNNLESGFIPAGDLTLVYDGDVDYPGGENAIPINLHTPYTHTGGNLVMMFQRRLDGTAHRYYNVYKGQIADNVRAIMCCDSFIDYDPYNPPQGAPTNEYPQVTLLYAPQGIPNELGTVSLTGNRTPTLGETTHYIVRIRNNGTQAQNNYTVKLTGTDNTELASVAGLPVGSQQTVDVTIPWTPSTAGEITIFGKIELDGDEIAHNDQTQPMTVNVQPQGVNAVTIGDGSQLGYSPIDFYNRNSLYQTLYLADELGFDTGKITSLALYTQFSTAVPNSHTRIWLGSTNQNDLSTGYIPACELTPVFDGNIDLPSGNNTILINLQTPYLHLGGNLVLMVNRPTASNLSATNYFKCQSSGTNRALHTFYQNYDSSTVHDPYGPPTGTLFGQYPQITFYYNSEPIPNDLAALTVVGNTTPTVELPSIYTVRVRNCGTQTQTNYTVKLVDADGVELASVAGPPIASQQILPVQLTFAPPAPGPFPIYAKVELTGDEIASNDHTQALNLKVNFYGTINITVGDGNQYARLPVDFTRSGSLFQTLYYPEELGGFSGPINGLTFSYICYHTRPNTPISIWLGTTTQTDLASGFIPSTELTLVYEGPVSFPGGQSVCHVNFDLPYHYEGGNLVMMVHKANGITHNSSVDFKCQSMGIARSRFAFSSYDDYDPANPPQGILGAQFPMTTFRVEIILMGHISGTVKDNQGKPISDANVACVADETTTNAEGRFSLYVPVGLYDVTAYLTGFESKTYLGVCVAPFETTNLSFVLNELPEDDSVIPVISTTLNGNYPNPFNPETTISYSVKDPGQVKLQIYNIKGQLVRTLMDADHATGHYKQLFDARDDRGRSLSSGVYLLRMAAPGYHKTSRMVLLQ